MRICEHCITYRSAWYRLDSCIGTDTSLSLKVTWRQVKGSRVIAWEHLEMHTSHLYGKFITFAEINTRMELWHKTHGHMSQKGVEKLSNLDKFGAKGTKLDFWGEHYYHKQVKNLFHSSVFGKSNMLDLFHSAAEFNIFCESLGISSLQPTNGHSGIKFQSILAH